MRLDLRIGTIAAAAALCLPVAAFGQRPVVEGISQRLTVACASGGAHVQGSGNTVTLTGPCASVLVEGQNNTVHIATLGSVKVAGMGNKVYWSAGLDGATPKVTKEGMGNTVERKAPADSDAPAKPQTTAPSTGGGTASATASSPTSSTTATAKPGAPTLTVGSGDRKVAMGASGDGASMSAKRGDPAPAKPPASSARSTSTAPATGNGLPILVPTNQQVKTMDCDGRPVSVQGNGNRLTLKGQCGPVTVGGNENILDIGSTTRIDTSGNRNVVKYRGLVDDKAPVVTSGGTGNRVSRAEPQ